MSTMNLQQLNDHLKKQFIEVLGTEFGEKVKAMVAGSVDEALKPDKADLTKAQATQQEWIDKLRGTKEGESLLSTAKQPRAKGQAFATVLRALWNSRNDVNGACRILEREGQEDLAELLKQSSKRYSPDDTKAMTAGDPETGGILIPQPVAQEIIDILRASVVVRRMGATALPMPSGNFRLPKKTQSSSSYYVGESQAATTSQVKTGSVLLSFKKLITIVPASNDLFRYSSPGADAMIRDDITDSMRVREDQAFLRDPGTTSTPKGLRQWALDATRSIAANGTINLDNVTTDLGKLVLKLVADNVPMSRPGWIMAPRTWNYLMTVRTTNGPYAFRDEMSRGTLWGWPFAYSTSVPVNLGSGGNESELYLVDFADVAIGDALTLVIDASGEASYEEGGSVKSAYHRDETVIRAITEHDLAVRRIESVAYLDGVKWT